MRTWTLLHLVQQERVPRLRECPFEGLAVVFLTFDLLIRDRIE